MLTVLLQGLLAGLAVALPLGAISVLLLHEAFTRGWWTAASGALGVAVVDLVYATGAATAGAAITRMLDGHEVGVHLIGAAVLVAVAIRGLLTIRRPVRAVEVTSGRAEPGDSTHRASGSGAHHPAAEVARVAGAAGSGPRRAGGVRPAAVFSRFVALTAINPLTAVYFAVLATGLALSGTGDAALFALGVFVGSLAWQLALVGIGAVVGERLPDGVRTAVGMAGYAIVMGYAVRLALS